MEYVRDHSPAFAINDDVSWLFLDHIEPHVYMDQWYVQPFNGQAHRMALIMWLGRALDPTHVIETGTYLGSSTPYLASLASDATITIEIDPEVHQKARERFRRNHPALPISAVLGDSAQMVRQSLGTINAASSRVLAYLDAHRRDQIPTTQELQALSDWGGPWAAVIDDFHVPSDSGYGFDAYGTTVIGPDIVPNLQDLQVWVPSMPAARETGARRGTGFVINAAAADRLSEIECAGLIRVR